MDFGRSCRVSSRIAVAVFEFVGGCIQISIHVVVVKSSRGIKGIDHTSNLWMFSIVSQSTVRAYSVVNEINRKLSPRRGPIFESLTFWRIFCDRNNLHCTIHRTLNHLPPGNHVPILCTNSCRHGNQR